MIRLAVLSWLALVNVSWAQTDYGLIRNHTGLSLVFPLQIKSSPGEDRLITLRDAETDEIALTALLEGGEFFRVLVPPGTFRLDFAIGTEWQRSEKSFGPATRFESYPKALTFGISGLSRKMGHLLDLRQGTSAGRPIGLCQVRVAEPRDPLFRRDAYDVYDLDDHPDQHPDNPNRYKPGLAHRRQVHPYPLTHAARLPDPPDWRVRERFCD